MLHGSAGAAFGVLLWMVLFSGAWSLGYASLQDWAQPPAGAAADLLPLERLLARATGQTAGLDELSLILPSAARPTLDICTGREGCPWRLDARDGRPLDTPSALDLPRRLHKTAFMGFPGRMLVSLFGLLLLVMTLSGLLLQRRRLASLVRLRGAGRTRVLHGLLGGWSLPWLVLFGVTGALSGLGALGTLLLAPVVYPQQPQRVFAELMAPLPPPARGEPAAQRVDLDALLRRDAARVPGFLPREVRLHYAGDAGASVEIAGFTLGVPSTPLFERHLYRADGTWLTDATARSRGAWLRAFIAVQPLHFALYDWLGRWSGLLAGLHLAMGLAACALVASGLWLWLQRRQGERRARWLARLALGLDGGLLLATAGLLLAVQLQVRGWLPDAVPGRVFLGLWGASLVLPWWVPLRRCCRAGAALTALACLLAAASHLLAQAGQGATVAWPVDLSLLLVGLACAGLAWRTGHSAGAASPFSVPVGDCHA